VGRWLFIVFPVQHPGEISIIIRSELKQRLYH